GGKPKRRPAQPVGGNWIWLLMLCLAAMLLVTQMQGTKNTLYWSEFYTLLNQDLLKEVSQNGDRYEGEVKKASDKNVPEAVKKKLDDLPDELKKKLQSGKFTVERLQGNDVEVQNLLNRKASEGLVVYAKPQNIAWLTMTLFYVLPLVLLIAFF